MQVARKSVIESKSVIEGKSVIKGKSVIESESVIESKSKGYQARRIARSVQLARASLRSDLIN